MQSVEPVGKVRALHDTAVPAIGVDLLRTRDGLGRYLGVGGAGVPIGVMDTGLNVRHVDIGGGRASICGANFVTWEIGHDDGRSEEDDLWIDQSGHGTHVTGTIVGAGIDQARYAGMAPAVKDIRFAKVLDSNGAGDDNSIFPGMDYLAEATGCDAADQPRLAKPLVVNMSLSGDGLHWEGRTVSERKLDATVWGARQLYVVANSNSGRSAFGNVGAAKNTLGVGAIRDDGRIAPFSSHGPTADGRLLPKLSATGVGLNSVRGGGREFGYDQASGTSMASPTVVGVAALVMDAAPDHRSRPALARARLMASAIRPDVWLESDAAFPATNTGGPGAVHAAYGLGKVSAPLAVLQRDEPDGWTMGGAVVTLKDGEYGHVDIEVPEGASRLDLVMTWDEPPAESIGDPVLNDLDLWLDHAADCEAAACGEHSSRSGIDNVEWIIVRNPPPGRWRAKVAAPRVYTAPPRAAVAWTLIRGESNPHVAIAAEPRSKGVDRTEIEATLTTDGFIAAAVEVGLGCRAAPGSDACEQVRIESASTHRPDGVGVELADELSFSGELGLVPGTTVPVGELLPERSRTLRLTVSHPPGEALLLALTASAWNGTGGTAAVGVGAADQVPALPDAPANDAFTDALEIDGATGSHAVDLLSATAGPAEFAFGGSGNRSEDRPRATVWYRWTAPAAGLAAFLVEGGGDSAALRLDVYRDGAYAELESLASGVGEVTFFAKAGRSYLVRLSDVGAGRRATLRWRPGTRPAHDDLAGAAVLQGERGEFKSSNGGATLEPGEWFNGTAATTWHRWTAPGDGWWSFERAGRSNVAVFEGDDWGSLRLVSGFEPGSSIAQFPAGRGREYRIMVGGQHALSPVGEYRLNWEPQQQSRRSPRNDEVEFAESLEGAAAGAHEISVEPQSTVSPGEPEATGIMTGWWSWQAPQAGRYTFRIGARDWRLAAFYGPGTDPLSLAGRIDPHGDRRGMAIDAEGDQRFWISAGFASNGWAAGRAYSGVGDQAALAWGPTPSNDAASSAAPLSGTAGSVTGNTRYATTDPGELRQGLGRSTVWWSYEAEESGWIKVEVQGDGGPWALTVLREGDGGSSEVVAQARSEFAEVRFKAVEGVRYAIAVGITGNAKGGAFDLKWARVDSHVGLRYVGGVAPLGRDASGETVELRGLKAMAAGGSALYLASEIGLQVFHADPETGALDLRQTFAVDLGHVPVVWDGKRSRLLVQGGSCGAWRVFDANQDGLGLVEGAVLMSEAPKGCTGLDELRISSDGRNLYRGTRDDGIHVFTLDGLGRIAYQSTTTWSGASIALSNDGGFLYALDLGTLFTYRRNGATGGLDYIEPAKIVTAYPAQDVAVRDDTLFVTYSQLVGDVEGPRVAAYALDDPAAPRALGNSPPYLANPDVEFDRDNGCLWAGTRPGSAAVGDAVCPRVALTFRADPKSQEVEVTDYVSTRRPDRFGNLAPDFGDAVAAVASPDGRHIYVASNQSGILAFRRVGTPDPSGSPP